MCRLYGFRSSVLSGVHQSLVAAENALLRQSERHPDGWGVAYYLGRYPHLIKSDKQAMSDGLFTDVSAVLSTRTLLAHIRQATVGKINILNCHPFQHGPWTFAHNGEVASFGTNEDVRRAILRALRPRYAAHVLGSTDSETCFALFLSMLEERVGDIDAEDLSLEATLLALRDTVSFLVSVADAGASEPSRLNFVVTNGSLLVGYRHRRSLYFSTHKSRCPERQSCPAFDITKCETEVKAGIVNHLIVSSEQVAQNPNVWVELEDGEFVAVDAEMRFCRGRLAELEERKGVA